MPDPFAARRDAIANSAPLDFTRARDVKEYVEHAPDYYEAIAARARAEADAMVDKVELAGEFTDALAGFNEALQRQVQRVREYGELFHRAHAAKLRRIEDQDPRQAAWDVTLNRS